MIEFDEYLEIEPVQSSLIRIICTETSEYYVRLSDINGIKKVFSHPNDSNDKKGFPKYQVFLQNGAWSWVLVPVEDFERYLKPFVNNI